MKKITLDNMDKLTTSYERKARRLARSLKIKAIFLGCFLGVFAFFWAFYQISKFYDEYRVVFNFPIVVQFKKPIEILPRYTQEDVKKPQEKPKNKQILDTKKQVRVKSEYEIVNEKLHGAILWKIYQLESQRGKTDYCRINNLGYGGFGVRDGQNIVCYPSFEVAVDRAEFWLSKLKPDENLARALCQWNLGIAVDNCRYYQNYLAVND